MRWFLLPVTLLAASAAFMLSGQTAAPNAAGISAGHVHLLVTDDVAMRKLLVDVLGGSEKDVGMTLQMVKFPNIFVIVGKARAALKGGSQGSTVHHVGFYVKSYADVKGKAEKAGLKVQELTAGQQAFIAFPDDVTVEVQQDAGVKGDAAEFNHFHLQVPDTNAAREWYMKTFGGTETERRKGNKGAGVPGAVIDFLAAGGRGGKAPAEPPQPTKGRSLDHIGFEVKDLQAFVDKLKADGIKMDLDVRDMTQQIGLKIAFITDPYGTSIELTEGLSKQ